MTEKEKPHKMDVRLLKRLDLIGCTALYDIYEDRKNHDIWWYYGNRKEHWNNSKFWEKCKWGGETT